MNEGVNRWELGGPHPRPLSREERGADDKIGCGLVGYLLRNDTGLARSCRVSELWMGVESAVHVYRLAGGVVAGFGAEVDQEGGDVSGVAFAA